MIPSGLQEWLAFGFAVFLLVVVVLVITTVFREAY